MANITIRNISQSVFDKLKLISRREKRSLNNEILRIIELGLSKIEAETGASSSPINKETQLAIWRELSGKWSDRRSAKTIIKEIYESRTPGREVEL
jgi:plasmid stability protein